MTTEFQLSDLNRIGPRLDADGNLIFQDYDGTGKAWYSYPIKSIGPDTRARQATRRSVLKAMVTRRDNKRRIESFKAAQS